MRYLALASDYDETLARHGQVTDSTLAALEEFRATGRKLLLVTGRELGDLQAVCPRLDLFDLVVAENGALLFDPHHNLLIPLADPPPPEFAQNLQSLGVDPVSLGRVIVATLRPFEDEARKCIERLGARLQIILNKDAVMILPQGVDKATGLLHALSRLNVPASATWAIGDAENDLVFLRQAGFPAAVANALPSVRSEAVFVTKNEAGAGVEELIRRILHEDT